MYDPDGHWAWSNNYAGNVPEDEGLHGHNRNIVGQTEKDMEMEERTDFDLKANAKPVFRKWEWLRLAFNVLVVLGIAPPWLISWSGDLAGVLGLLYGALPSMLVLNLLFFVWPAIELYARWMGAKGKCVTIVLILIALVVSFAMVTGYFFLWDWHHLGDSYPVRTIK